MAKKVISMSLSQKSIQNAINELRNYQSELKRKTELFVKKLAEVGIPVIDENMAKANYTYDDKGIRSGSDTSHYTHVQIHTFGDYAQAKLIVENREIAFIEFGSGVYYNGSAGASPHPKGQEFGFLIGSYGAGHGQQKVWGYYDEGGNLVLTHGVEATMPMLHAYEEIVQKCAKVAREVFGSG